MKSVKNLILYFLSIFIISSPIKVESFDLTKNEANLQSFLSIDSLKMSPLEKDSAVRIELEGMMANTPFKINGSLGPLANAFDPDLKWPVRLILETAGANLRIVGTINDLNQFKGIDLNFVLSGQNLAEFEDIFGKKFPVMGPFKFSGHLKDTFPLQFEISELNLEMEKSELKGFCRIDLSKERPEIEADFYSTYLDLRKLFATNDVSSKNETLEKTPEENKTSSIRIEKVFSNKPLDLEFLKFLDLKLKLSGEKLLVPRYALMKFQLQTSIKGGAFSVDHLTGDIGGGRLDGKFKMEPSYNTYILSTQLDISRMDFKRMLEDMETDIKGEGMVDLSLNLNARGVSMSELMAGLDGHTRLVTGEGRIDRRYMGLFRINLISSIVKILSIPVGSLKKEEMSDINCLVMRFDIEGGMANLTAFILDTPKTTIAANGKIDLSSEKVDIYVKPISKEGIGAKGLAKFNLSLSELTRVLYLGGTLANPNVAIDSAQTFFTLGKAIGGVVLFGPAGVAAALLTGKIGGGSKNLCLEAIEVAEKGVEIGEEKTGLFNRLGDLMKRLNPISK